MLRRCTSWGLGIALALLLAAPFAAAAPKEGNGGPKGPPAKVLTRHAGEAYCPAAMLVYGTVLIPGGRCYMLSILRDSRGTFLAFVPPGQRIPPGQLVRLNTPAGPKLKGRLFLVPIQTSVVLLPLNTMTLVAVQIQDFGARLLIVLLGTPVPNLTIPFVVR